MGSKSALKSWFQDSYDRCVLSSKTISYLEKRGANQNLIVRYGFRTWEPADSPCPYEPLAMKIGTYGEEMEGWLISPYLSPKGEIFGFEGRSMGAKKFVDARSPECKWNPVFFGLTPLDMEYLWVGKNVTVWLVEGVFDLIPLKRILPPSHVVLATMTANLSYSQGQFLRRFGADQAYVAFDMDDPGRAGAEKAEERLRRAGLQVENISYLGGKDPGVIWDNFGEDGLNRFFGHYLF